MDVIECKHLLNKPSRKFKGMPKFCIYFMKGMIYLLCTII